MAKQCCCGRYKLDDPLIVNMTMHEQLGKLGAFCGPLVNHQLRDAEAEIESLKPYLRRLTAAVRQAGDISAWPVCGEGDAVGGELAAALKEAEELL